METEHLLNEEHRVRTNKRVRNVSIFASLLIFATIAILVVFLMKNQMESNLSNEFTQANNYKKPIQFTKTCITEI